MRRIVICTDGTWNEPDQKNEGFDVRRPSNVVKVARGVLPVTSDGVSQIVYYDQGVGTHSFVDKLLGGATGVGLVDNILQAYRFLVHNYQFGDQIYLFGFSRGAYTARSLSGLINAIRLLRKDQVYWLPEGYELYRSKATQATLKKYRTLNKSTIPPIEAVCVWDTVGAVGIPIGFLKEISRRKYSFHDQILSSNVDHGYHALAIDEKRDSFEPTLWLGKSRSDQILEQIWFAGVHSGIGGGYRDDGLADCALHWMVEKASSHGLEFNKRYLNHFKADPLDTFYESRKNFYKLTAKHIRPINHSKTRGESVHSTAIERYNSEKVEYQPSNLSKYIKKNL